MNTKKETAYAGILELDRAIAPLWYAALEDSGVSVGQAEVLFILGIEDASISRLSKELGVTGSAVTQTIEAMEKKKLVKREHRSSDRRVVTVMLADSGEACLRDLLQARRHLVNSLLENFTEQELTALITLHKKMIDSIKE